MSIKKYMSVASQNSKGKKKQLKPAKYIKNLKENQNKPTFKQLLIDCYDQLKEMLDAGKLRSVVWESVAKMLICNTAYLGYDLYECPNCGEFITLYHKCHSKLCPSCGIKKLRMLTAGICSFCLAVKHRHIVFTIPENYRILFLCDREALDLLFIAARNTIYTCANKKLYEAGRKKKKEEEEKENGKKKKGKKKKKKTKSSQKTVRLRGSRPVENDKDRTYLFKNCKHKRIPGMIACLHTFGRDLKWNPHIHMLVAEVLWDPDQNKTIDFSYIDFTLLRKTWQYELNRLLADHFKGKTIDGKTFNAGYRNPSYNKYTKGYYVYAGCDPEKEAEDLSERDQKQAAQKQEMDIKGAIKYILRYSNRPAMAESRLLAYNPDTKEVTWYYEDHADGKRKEVTEPAIELLKKMFIHIPSKGFRMVRYYGFYHPKCKNVLDNINEAFGKENKPSRTREERAKDGKAAKAKVQYRNMLAETYSVDPLKCRCGATMNCTGSKGPDRRLTIIYVSACAEKYVAERRKVIQKAAAVSQRRPEQLALF